MGILKAVCTFGKNPGCSYATAYETFLSSLQFSHYKAATFGEADNGKE